MEINIGKENENNLGGDTERLIRLICPSVCHVSDRYPKLILSLS
jgi:hypothetical protein